MQSPQRRMDEFGLERRAQKVAPNPLADRAMDRLKHKQEIDR